MYSLPKWRARLTKFVYFLLKCRTLLYLLWSPPHCTPIHLRLLDWHKPLPWLNHVTIDRLSDGYLRCWWQRRGSFRLVNLRKKHQNGSGDCGVKLRIRSSFSTNLHRSVPLWIECATKDWGLVFLWGHAHLAVGINFGWWVERRNLRTMLFLKNGPSQPLFSLFSVFFKQTPIHFYSKLIWKMSIQYMALGFEPTPFRTWVSSHYH